MSIDEDEFYKKSLKSKTRERASVDEFPNKTRECVLRRKSKNKSVSEFKYKIRKHGLFGELKN